MQGRSQDGSGSVAGRVFCVCALFPYTTRFMASIECMHAWKKSNRAKKYSRQEPSKKGLRRIREQESGGASAVRERLWEG